MNFTIKDLPPQLHRKLKPRAAANKRSLNWEVIDILEGALESRPVDVPALIREVDAVHARITVTPLNENILRRASQKDRC